MLKSIYLGFRKVKVQRVTVVEFGMHNRGGDGVGWENRRGRAYGAVSPPQPTKGRKMHFGVF